MTLLACRNIRAILGEKTVLEDAALSLSAGEMVGLIGPNGAGKTSLLRCLAGLLTPETGVIDFASEHVQNRQRFVAYLPQSPEVHWPLTVERVVALGRIPHLSPWSRGSEADRLAIDKALTDTDMDAFRRREVTSLSGGERMRALIARAFAVEPTVILADEPVAALDPLHRLQTMTLLQQHCRRGGGAIVVLHDLTLAARYCNRLALMAAGRMVIDGRPNDVIASGELERVYGVTTKVIEQPDGTIVVPWSPVEEGPA